MLMPIGRRLFELNPTREAVFPRQRVLDVTQPWRVGRLGPGGDESRPGISLSGAQRLQPDLRFLTEIVDGCFRGERTRHANTFFPLLPARGRDTPESPLSDGPEEGCCDSNQPLGGKPLPRTGGAPEPHWGQVSDRKTTRVNEALTAS